MHTATLKIVWFSLFKPISHQLTKLLPLIEIYAYLVGKEVINS
jgi:hypothetical protein